MVVKVGKWKPVVLAVIGVIVLAIGTQFGPEWQAMAEKASVIAEALFSDETMPADNEIIVPEGVSVTTAL